MPKPCRQEFRDDVVKVARIRPEGATLKRLAADFGIHSMTLSKWFRQVAVGDGDRPGVTTTESVGDGIPVTVSCRVLQFARAAHHRWLNTPFTDGQRGEARRGWRTRSSTHIAMIPSSVTGSSPTSPAKATTATCRSGSCGGSASTTAGGRGRPKRAAAPKAGTPAHDVLADRYY